MSVNEKTNYNEMMDKIMDKITNQITMLGTGNATVSQIYNTCFLLKTPSTLMLVDAGGGNGILSQLKKVNVQISDIHHLFVTHAHTDHVLYNPQNEMFSHLGMKRYNFKNETQLFKVIPHTSKNQKNRPASPERNTFEGS